MTTELPGNLGEILPLRLRLREALSFASQQGLLMAYRERDGQRFLLKRWQYEILGKMDGRRTFGELAEETQQLLPGRFSTEGLLNFYSWLYHENLVTVATASIFEFDAEGDTGPEWMKSSASSAFNSPSAATTSSDTFSLAEATPVAQPSAGGEVLRRKSRLNRRSILQLAALLIFSLCLLRIGLVMAPAFTPAATRLVAMWKGVELSPQGTVVAETERVLPPTRIVERELASKAVAEIPLPQAAAADEAHVAKPKASSPVSNVPAPVTESATDPGRLDSLRKELAACRIRRDEFYIQEDEAGYRHEVERMAAIVKELGEIETGH